MNHVGQVGEKWRTITWGIFWKSRSDVRMGSPCCIALAAIQMSLLATGVPAFLRKAAMMDHRSAVSWSMVSTSTLGERRNSCKARSFSYPLLPSKNPAFSSPNTMGVR